MTGPNLDGPWYTGTYTHFDKEGGYSIVMPTDWHQLPLKKNIIGLMFSPYENDLNTSVLTQKKILKYKVKTGDLLLLREGFEEGIKALPGAEIEKIDASYSETVNVFDGIFTYLDGEIRRKRWVRNIYWAEAQLIVIAQGKTPEDYEYWLPMFYNIMTTLSII